MTNKGQIKINMKSKAEFFFLKLMLFYEDVTNKNLKKMKKLLMKNNMNIW